MKPHIKFESFHESHERIFGNKSFTQLASDDTAIHIINPSKKKTSKNKKPELCPHCSTKNLIRKDEYNRECKNCGWSD